MFANAQRKQQDVRRLALVLARRASGRRYDRFANYVVAVFITRLDCRSWKCDGADFDGYLAVDDNWRVRAASTRPLRSITRQSSAREESEHFGVCAGSGMHQPLQRLWRVGRFCIFLLIFSCCIPVSSLIWTCRLLANESKVVGSHHQQIALPDDYSKEEEEEGAAVQKRRRRRVSID